MIKVNKGFFNSWFCLNPFPHSSILFEIGPLWSEIWRSAVFLGRKIAELDINKLMPVCFAFFSKIDESLQNRVIQGVEFLYRLENTR